MPVAATLCWLYVTGIGTRLCLLSKVSMRVDSIDVCFWRLSPSSFPKCLLSAILLPYAPCFRSSTDTSRLWNIGFLRMASTSVIRLASVSAGTITRCSSRPAKWSLAKWSVPSPHPNRRPSVTEVRECCLGFIKEGAHLSILSPQSCSYINPGPDCEVAGVRTGHPTRRSSREFRERQETKGFDGVAYVHIVVRVGARAVDGVQHIALPPRPARDPDSRFPLQCHPEHK
ncbi:hypothetical protein OF83DRAFT_1134021 [Amylostereum chailletii]|nr:hypothetical protein OF83DRAFT_1134021 [Amylostereum chailletii]